MVWDILVGLGPSTLTAFVLAGLLLNFTPGVDFLLISSSSIQGGPKIGIAAGVGINISVILHILAAAAGVSALLIAYPAAYEALRYAGAAYLIYLAWRAWQAGTNVGEGSAAPSVFAAVRRGFLTNFLNPKTALFIFAFIPQFTDPAVGPIWVQILVLGAIFFVNGFIFTICLATATGLIANRMRSHVAILNRMTSILFVGLAARLAFD